MRADRDRTAILNAFGRTIGDSVIGLQALEIACRQGVLEPRITSFRHSGFSPLLPQIYGLADDLLEVRDLPRSFETPQTRFTGAEHFARTIDIRDFAFDPEFRAVAMIDFFLRKLGIDPASVEGSAKRMTWLSRRLPLGKQTTGTPYVLVVPRTSTKLRDMPDEVHAFILDWLSRHTDLAIRTQGSRGGADAERVTEVPAVASFAELCALAAGATAIISADTALIHLADAYSVPCLAVFTSHRPEWRVRDYPLCMPVHRPIPGAPDSMEFPRSDDDFAAAARGWFNAAGAQLGWLEEALAVFFAGRL